MAIINSYPDDTSVSGTEKALTYQDDNTVKLLKVDDVKTYVNHNPTLTGTVSLPDISVTAQNFNFASLKTRKTVDANGWTVIDWGAWKEYLGKGSWLNIDALGNAGASTIKYPVGVTMNDIIPGGSAFLTCALVADDQRTCEPLVSGSVKLTSTVISFGIKNNAPSGAWFGGCANFRIIK